MSPYNNTYIQRGGSDINGLIKFSQRTVCHNVFTRSENHVKYVTITYSWTVQVLVCSDKYAISEKS